MSVFFETSTRKLLTGKMTSARLGASAGPRVLFKQEQKIAIANSGGREWK